MGLVHPGYLPIGSWASRNFRDLTLLRHRRLAMPHKTTPPHFCTNPSRPPLHMMLDLNHPLVLQAGFPGSVHCRWPSESTRPEDGLKRPGFGTVNPTSKKKRMKPQKATGSSEILIPKSIDWFKGKITGKSHILWFPVDFPLSQPID